VQPISYESMVENALDPSHAPFLHSGLKRNGSELSFQSIPMENARLSGKIAAGGFVIKHGGYDPRTKGMDGVRTFKAPSLVDVRYTYAGGAVRTSRSSSYLVPRSRRESSPASCCPSRRRLL